MTSSIPFPAGRETARRVVASLRACAAVAALLTAISGCGDSGAGTMACNGHPELCDRPFDQVAFAGAHNAMSVQDEGWQLPNQIHGMTDQLEMGVRVFLLDTHEYQGGSWLCHEFCELGKEPLVSGLRKFTDFLATHPNEVVTFVIQNGISNAATEAAFVESGLIDYVYTWPVGSPWPTLRQMIENGTRLLVLAESSGPPPAWYQDAYELSWDTPYAFYTPADFNCDLNRGARDNPLFQVNHWLSNPLSKPANGEEVNVFDVLWPRVEQCRQEAGRIPNFVVVDYVSIGDLIRVVDRLNGF